MVIGVVPKSITAVNRQSGLTDGLFQVTTPYFYDPLKGAVLPVGTVTRANSLRGLLYNFDGTSYLRYANEEKITPPFTVAFDVIFQTVGFDLFQPIVAQGGVGVTLGFKVAIASNGIRVTFGGVADYFISNSTSANVPYRVCVTVSGNGGTAIAYKNGASVGSVAVGTMQTPAGTGTRIGADATAQVFSGTRIGNVALWNRALSASEVLLLNNISLISSQPRYVHTDSTPSPTSRTFFIPRKKVMTSQPQGSSVSIDWGNPITQGLASAYLPTTAQYRSFDLATNTIDTTSGAEYLPPYRPGARGLALDSTDNNYVWSVQFNPVALRGYPRTGYAALTVFSLFERSTAQSGAIYGGGESGTYYARLVVDSNGAIQFIASSNNVTVNPFTPVISTNTVYSAAGVQRFSQQYRAIYLNGNLSDTNTSSITNLNNGFFAGSVYNVQLRRIKLYCGYVWVRELSAAEIKSLSDNPWQIFKQNRLYPALSEEGKVYAPFMS